MLFISRCIEQICIYMWQIFSNGNAAHVAKVLGKLGLEDCFEDIICFETLNPTKASEEPENSCDGESRIIL